MKQQLIWVFLFIGLFAGCQLASYAPAPPVTSAMITTSVSKQAHADLSILAEGRRLFVHRCIECHTLPPIWHYTADEWPGIVDAMSRRASLRPAEEEAIIAYISAVRSQR